MCLNYLWHIYMPVIDDIAVHSTRSHRKSCVKATSRTESSNAAIKAQLLSRTGDLRVLHTGILEMLQRQMQQYDGVVTYQRERVLP